MLPHSGVDATTMNGSFNIFSNRIKVTFMLEERKNQAYLNQTTPDCIVRRVDTGQWLSVEYEIGQNYPDSYRAGTQRILHPLTFQNLELDPPDEPSLDTIMQIYVFRNRVVQDFLMEHTDAEAALFILNNQLETPLDASLEALFVQYATVFLDRVREMGQELATAQCVAEYLNPRITAFRIEYEREQQLERELGALALPHGGFVQTAFVPSFVFSPDAYAQIRNLDQLLDRALVSSEVPLIVRPTVHKVLKGYEYTLDKKIPTDKPNQFQYLFLWTLDGKAIVEHDLRRQLLTLSYELSSAEEDSASRLELLGVRTLGFSLENFIVQPAQLQGEVQVSIAAVPFQLELWRELLMNDARAQQLFALNELQLTQSLRPAYAGADNPESVEPQEVLGDLTREEDLNALPHIYLPTGTEFSVRLSDTDQLILRFEHLRYPEEAERISRHFAQCLGLYRQQRRALIQAYRQFTSLLSPVSLPPTALAGKSKKKPKINVIFEANYTRAIGGKVPTIVTREEARALQNAGTQVMAFPKADDLGPGEQPMYFSCHLRDQGYIYPGLHLNPNPEGKYPLLPCCYKEDQLQKKHSNAYEYFAPESRLTFADYRMRQKDRSFVDVDQTDKCPDLISELYQLNSLVAPVRWGVHRTPLSALECVMFALNHNGFRAVPLEQRPAVVEEEYVQLFQRFPYANELCAQERWDQPPTAVPPPTADTYFDLRHWVRLVEEAYSCHIVLLDPKDFVRYPTVQGRWVWSRVTHLPVVVLYEHSGVSRASYPQCEWITFTEDLDPMLVEHRYVDTYALEASGSVPALQVEYDSLRVAFESAQLELDSQHIDYYGKVYAWNVKRNGTTLTVFFRHIRVPPLHLPRASEVFFGRLDEWAVGEAGVQQFIRLGTFECAVYTQPHVESARERYDFTRVQVDLLTENAKRLYAQRVETGQSPDDWSFIRVNLDQAYRPLNRFLFDSSNTVYVPNTQSKTRLEYFLRLYRRRRYVEWLAYLSATTIPFTYQSVSDFQVQENAIVLENTQLADWKYVQYAPVELTGLQKPLREPFLVWIDHTLYRCTWMGDVETASERIGESEAYRLFFPQSQRIFEVGDLEAVNDPATYVATKHVVTQELTLYRARRFRTV